MFASILEDVKQQFRFGNRITRLIIFNTAAFIAVNLVKLIFTMSAGFQAGGGFQSFMSWLQLSSDIVHDFTHPWVFITHMFLHLGFWHFLFNMLFLYWFGRIVADLIGDDKVYPLYFMAGLSGALIFLITAPLIYPATIPAYGASAAVMGFVVASGVLAPDYVMRLLFIGDVKLKYIVFALVLLDLFSIANLSNTGGHFAHLGGAAFGWLFVVMLRQGSDLSQPFNRLLDWFERLLSGGRKAAKPKKTRVFVRHVRERKGRRASDSGKAPGDDQDRIDAILDKIKASGYESLTPEEKEFLFRASKK
ncbi:MAG: rhomboid family intramembrane serine protease [Saprospiraceae bacterium]|nr:rhomboid family intramembrane serine protease [Saprospiraceae bacterium]